MECKLKRGKDVVDRQVEELIDTLWNVNSHGALRSIQVAGINRYIMECKLSYK